MIALKSVKNKLKDSIRKPADTMAEETSGLTKLETNNKEIECSLEFHGAEIDGTQRQTAHHPI